MQTQEQIITRSIQLSSNIYYIQTIIYKMQPQKEQANQPVDYQQENRLLMELFMQRRKAQQQQQQLQANKKEQKYKDGIDEEEDIMMIRPRIKQIEIKKQEEKGGIAHQKDGRNGMNLWLNMPVFDSRQKKPNFFVKIFSFFNQDVTKPKMKVSQNVQSIFITTYGFETQTFQPLLTTPNLKLTILSQSDQKQTNKIIKNYSGFQNFTVIFKAKNQNYGYGVFHTKLWLVKFRDFLRVVVCTSNQHLLDWAVWQNAFWFQDFPIKTGKQEVKPKQSKDTDVKFDFNKDFHETLTSVLVAMHPRKQLEQLTSINIDNYSFQNIKVVLIPSIPGRHTDLNIKKQGLGKVRQIMKIFNKVSNPVMTYNSTSLGKLDSDFLHELYTSFCPQKQLSSFDPANFRLIYPTKRYIEQQTGGQAQNYQASNCARAILHRYDTNPANPILGSIPHLKTIIIESKDNKDNNPNQNQNPNSNLNLNPNQNKKCIMYLGSHNMTRAAWGKLEKKGSQLYIANSELGLLFFDVDLEAFRKWSPFSYPPEKYRQNDQPFLREFN